MSIQYRFEAGESTKLFVYFIHGNLRIYFGSKKACQFLNWENTITIGIWARLFGQTMYSSYGNLDRPNEQANIIKYYEIDPKKKIQYKK